MEQQRTAEDIRAIAEHAYVFGFPLVLMDMTRAVTTAVPRADDALHKAPINQITHMREFPDASFTDVVSPNADTLYSIGFLDLQREPMVLSVPEMGDRYYLMEMLDAWTNVFASPGTRTTGNRRGDFAIVGPDWSGELPKGVHAIRAPTNLVWIIGRTQTNGKQDFAAVHAIQDQYLLTPLSELGNHYRAPTNVPVENVDTRTPPLEQVEKMPAAAFFDRLNALMKANPPAAEDDVESFAAIGVAPGEPFRMDRLDTGVAKSIEQGARDGRETIHAAANEPHGRVVNGWDLLPNLGRYGTDYLWRSVVAEVGLGANLEEDAIYPRAIMDGEGVPLTGAGRYQMYFPNGQLPPVGAFWSVTMYDSNQFFVPNPIDRYAIGDRDQLEFAPDGSLTLYVQHDSPGKELESNWLPAPKEEFSLLLRLYEPSREILDGHWKIPPLERVE